MDAIYWLMDNIVHKMRKKLLLTGIGCAVVLAGCCCLMEVMPAVCLSITCMCIVTERLCYSEIAKNNVVPLMVICRSKRVLVKLFAGYVKKVILSYAPLLMVVAVVCTAVRSFSRKDITDCVAAVFLVFVGCLAVSYLHLWLLLYHNKKAMWFEMFVFFLESMVAQVLSMTVKSEIYGLVAYFVMLLFVSYIGRNIIRLKERGNRKYENLYVEKMDRDKKIFSKMY